MQRTNSTSWSKCPAWFYSFLLLTWLHMLWLTYGFFTLGLTQFTPGLNTLFHVSTWLFYSFFYLLPVCLLGYLSIRFAGRHHLLTLALVWLSSSLILLAIQTDHMIYDLYSFHINRFVLNLLLTPGGISSLGSSDATYISTVLIVLRILVLQLAIVVLSRLGGFFCAQQLKPVRWIFGVSVCLFLIQGVAYGISDIQQYGPVLDGSKAYPLFRRVRFRSLARSLGYTPVTVQKQELTLEEGNISYPLAPVSFQNEVTPPNIIMLVAESLRWDQLDSTIMPNTWQFSNNNVRFAKHYSSGNGTREGLFGLFYGLYGSYWDSFMHARQSPLLMDRVQALDYQLDIRTSATFTYPEFDKTLFANVPPAVMTTADDNLSPWQRDQFNTDGLLQFLEQRNTSQPFMTFMFFESTHAAYSFPEEHALYADYQGDMDYTRVSKAALAENITPLFNRYHNAAYWVDVQLGRIYAKLAEENLLDNTIVIVTGDHGEEFMEHGAWGHNSSFVEEQTHVPLVMHVPHSQPQVIDATTTHLDIATTLLQELGAQGKPEVFSLGHPILATAQRPYIVLSDWHSISVQTPSLKYRIPYLTSGGDYWKATDETDELLPESDATFLVSQQQHHLLQAITNTSLFYTE